jgi:hypothetical protein
MMGTSVGSKIPPKVTLILTAPSEDQYDMPNIYFVIAKKRSTLKQVRSARLQEAAMS